MSDFLDDDFDDFDNISNNDKNNKIKNKSNNNFNPSKNNNNSKLNDSIDDFSVESNNNGLDNNKFSAKKNNKIKENIISKPESNNISEFKEEKVSDFDGSENIKDNIKSISSEKSIITNINKENIKNTDNKITSPLSKHNKTKKKSIDIKSVVTKNTNKSNRNNSKTNNNLKNIQTLKDLLLENKQLFDKLKTLNTDLTKLIDKKGYKNILENIKKEKNKNFKFKPTSIQLKTYNNEIINNNKTIEILKKEFEKLENSQSKISDPIHLSNIKRKILTYNNNIKKIKSDIYEYNIESKRNENCLVKNPENIAYNYKSIILEIDLNNKKNDELLILIKKMKNNITKQDDLIANIQKDMHKVKSVMKKLNITLENKFSNDYKDLIALINKRNEDILIIDKKIKNDSSKLNKDIEIYYSNGVEFNKRIQIVDNIIKTQREKIYNFKNDDNIIYQKSFNKNAPDKVIKKTYNKSETINKKEDIDIPIKEKNNEVNESIINNHNNNEEDKIIKKEIIFNKKSYEKINSNNKNDDIIIPNNSNINNKKENLVSLTNKKNNIKTLNKKPTEDKEILTNDLDNKEPKKKVLNLDFDDDNDNDLNFLNNKKDKEKDLNFLDDNPKPKDNKKNIKNKMDDSDDDFGFLDNKKTKNKSKKDDDDDFDFIS